MEIKNEIDKLAEMMQREFGAAQSERGELRKELKELKEETKEKFNRVDERFNEVDEKFNRVDERFNEVLGREDRILKSLGNLETDNTMSAGASRRQEDKLENHEERIVVAEEKLGIGETV